MKTETYKKLDLIWRGIAVFLLFLFGYLMFTSRNLEPEEINGIFVIIVFSSIFVFALITAIIFIINFAKRINKKRKLR